MIIQDYAEWAGNVKCSMCLTTVMTSRSFRYVRSVVRISLAIK